jgi:hypothetical protein
MYMFEERLFEEEKRGSKNGYVSTYFYPERD